MPHPRTAALVYSSSVKGRSLRISTLSTTDIPRLSLPPGTLYSKFCARASNQDLVLIEGDQADLVIPFESLWWESLFSAVLHQLISDGMVDGVELDSAGGFGSGHVGGENQSGDLIGALV